MRLIEDPRRGGTQMRDVPEESLMLTGDENIVDVDFSVFWLVKTGGAGDYLFNIQNPEGTVKAVAESAMREVVGRSEIQPILTGARQTIETAVHDLMQKVLDTYQAGIQVTQVQMQKVDPPAQVIDASATCRRRAPTSNARRTRGRPTPTASCPRRAAGRRRSSRRPKPIASRPSPKPRGQAARFSKVYEQYKKAPDGHPPAHLSGDDGARVRRHRQDHPRSGRAGRHAGACRADPAAQ